MNLKVNKRTYNIFTYLYSLLIVIAFYSFGTFGFTNIFGMRNSLQAIVISGMVFSLVSLYYFFKKYDVKFNKLILIFSPLLYYGVAFSITSGDILTSLIQVLVAINIIIFLLYVDFKYIKKISKSIMYITFVFSIMGFISWFLLLSDPSIKNNMIFDSYSSLTGSKIVSIGHWIEYLSLTSGDGFELFGINVSRVKSFCPEPSGTIVHMLAPIVFALFFKKYFIALFILVFNFFAIGSLVGWIAIFVSLGVYMIFTINNKLFRKSFFLFGILLMLFLMYNVGTTVDLILDLGQKLYETTSSSLVARKQGSASVRLESFKMAIDLFLSNPFGFVKYNTMTGLFTNLILQGGIFIFILLVMFFYKILDSINSMIDYITNYEKMMFAFICGILIVGYFISGYGWDRIPGVIILTIYYRYVKYFSSFNICKRN